MSSPISSNKIMQSCLNQNSYPIDSNEISLHAIRAARGDVSEIKQLLNDNLEICLKLFKKAIDERDAISQIELAEIYYLIKWHETSLIGFSGEEKFTAFIIVYDQAMKVESDLDFRKKIAKDTLVLLPIVDIYRHF